MDAPPVQYVKTSDGYDIAYSVAGAGQTLLTMPLPFSHATLSWTAPGLRETCVALAQKFRVVHFDARGQGLSSRGLSDSHREEEYLLDLDAIAGALKLQNFVLFAGVALWKAAVIYAARKPERLLALVLLNPTGSVTASDQPSPRETQIAGDWETFLLTTGSTFNPTAADHAERLRLRDHMRQCVDQADYLKMQNAARVLDVRPWLVTVRTPTLVIRQESPWNTAVSSDIAAAIPGARLVLLDDYGSVPYSATGHTPPGVTAIEEFLADLPDAEAHARAGSPSDRLSAREIEVLRLLATGRSNQQIADELVISLNTVNRHVSNIYAKTGAANRAQAVAYAKDNGIA